MKLHRLTILTIIILFSITSFAFTFPKQILAKCGIHSSDLEIVMSGNESRERKDFYNNGILTYAADKHYATIVITRNDSIVLEEYYDVGGKPAQQINGHYKLLREYDEQKREYKITYLGIEGQPIINNDGYCYVLRSFNELDEVISERYYDAEGCPIGRKNGSFGCRYLYETNASNYVVFLDEDYNTCRIKSGYAIRHRYFYIDGDDKGRVEYEFYFDESENPISLSIGQYGVHYKYDELGRKSVLTYLDAEGSPTITRGGYTTVKRSYYPDDTIEIEMYYDQNDEPVALSHGQYGIKHSDGKKIYLDKYGHEVFELNNWLHNNPWAIAILSYAVISVSMAIEKRGNGILLIGYVAFIIYMTLMYRTDGESRAELDLFWSYKQFFSSSSLRLEILNNIWLFIPLGAILFKLWPKAYILLVPVLLSILIETIQYFTGLGLCELDDVISNSLGGALGFGFAYSLEPMVMGLRKRLCLSGN